MGSCGIFESFKRKQHFIQLDKKQIKKIRNSSPEKNFEEEKREKEKRYKEEEAEETIIKIPINEELKYRKGELCNEIIEESIIINKSKFEKQFSIHFKNLIDKVYELSNKRIAVLDDYNEEIKIYSLKSGNLINKITHEFISNIVELKNKDLVINSTTSIYLYKLIQENYELYQTIDEFKQKTFTICPGFLGQKQVKIDNYYNLNSIYQLKNGDLVSCNSYGIKIYKKDNKGKYKLSLIEKINEGIENAIEIKKNVLFLFCKYFERPIPSFFHVVLEIYKYDIEKKEFIKLSRNYVRDVDFYDSFGNFSYLVNNNYLLVRSGLTIEVYNKEAELIYKSNYEQSGENNLPIKDFYCNYKNNIFIARNGNNKIKMITYKSKNFQEITSFLFTKEYIAGIIKTTDNKFIINLLKELKFIKNFNK